MVQSIRTVKFGQWTTTTVNTTTDVPQTLKFWDSVAPVYASNPMTKTENDDEINSVLESVKHMSRIEKILSIGVADGCRDPTFLLEHMKQSGMSIPLETHINDISPEMMELATNRVKEYGTTVHKYVGPIQNFIDKIMFTNAAIFIGVYDMDYLDKAMAIYLTEKKIIGSEITLTPIYWDSESNKMIEGFTQQIYFNIDSWEIWRDSWHSWRESLNLVSIRFKTETGFISHYFNKSVTEDMMDALIEPINSASAEKYGLPNPAINIAVEKPSDRYLVFKMYQWPNSSRTEVVTMINNVLGNIKTSDQVDVLRGLLKMIELK
jgi:hypothetical protein